MKRLAHFALLPLLAAAAGAQAETYLDNARVRSVDPQYQSVRVPRQECINHWVDEPHSTRGREYGGAVLGGVAGAVIGNQIGRSHGREAATAIGAVIGAVAGDKIANRGRWDTPERAQREVTTCRHVDDVQTQIVGYRVTYDYRGQQFTRLMHENPGPYLQVRVSVEPVGR
jgi:uncharacterized protein YcfJ